MTIRELFEQARAKAHDESPVIHCTIQDRWLDEKNQYIAMGAAEGLTIWSERRVYFPLQYDGDLWIGSAPRDPCDEAVKPQGGG